MGKIVGTANKLNGIGFVISDEWIGYFLLAGLTDEYKPFIMRVESSGMKITGDSIKSRLYEMVPTSSASSQQAFFGKRAEKPKLRSVMKCYGCGKVGHKRSQCWKKKRKLVPNQIQIRLRLVRYLRPAVNRVIVGFWTAVRRNT